MAAAVRAMVDEEADYSCNYLASQREWKAIGCALVWVVGSRGLGMFYASGRRSGESWCGSQQCGLRVGHAAAVLL